MKTVLLTLLSVLLIGTSTQAQENQELEFEGKVYAYGENLEGAVVKIFEAGEMIDFVETKRNGKFEFVAEPEKEYMVEVAKEGMVTKILWINTRKTENIAADIKKFEFDVSLRREKKSDDAYDEIYNLPVALIKYDKSKNAFASDPSYQDVLDRRRKQLIAQTTFK